MAGTPLQTLVEAASSLVNPALERWKDQGGQVVGYFCSMVPEELILAAGLLPFRVRATRGSSTRLAEAYFSPLDCSFPRQCFDLALDGQLDFLDGVVCVDSCEPIRRLYHNWRRFVPAEFIEFLRLPRHPGPDPVVWYRQEFARLRERLQTHFGVEIRDEDLRQAIRLANLTRRLQRHLYQLRKRDRPPLTGAETLAVMLAGNAMPRRRYHELLRELLDEVGDAHGTRICRARLMITGGSLDDPAWVKAIEDQGGLVVTDVTCFGTRLVWRDVDGETDDPLAALAGSYLVERPGCARWVPSHEEPSHLVQDLFREFRCDGVIGERMMHCGRWQVAQRRLSRDLEAQGIPFLTLDRSVPAAATAELGTRVQAFIESMGR